MATNPMQRKARNSFLLGMVLMLLICGLIIAFLFWQVTNMKKAEQELEASYVNVCVLTRDIESGEQVTSADVKEVRAIKSAVPNNLVTMSQLMTDDIQGDEEENQDEDSNAEERMPIARISLGEGTVLAGDMLYLDGNTITNDVRKQELNTVILPMDLTTGDYIDIRLLMPTGQDYIVVSKKQVEVPNVAGVDSTDTIWINLSEAEILTMSNAIVEAFMINGSKLYATKYVEAGNQEASQLTYPLNGEVGRLMEMDGNVLEEARQGLRERYSANDSELRGYINNQIGGQDDALSAEQSGMTESITNSQTAREEYLQSLSAGTTVPVE